MQLERQMQALGIRKMASFTVVVNVCFPGGSNNSKPATVSVGRAFLLSFF